jgi:hypothetical protein
MLKIAEARFPVADYNIYVAQASDGDNFSSDVERCTRLLAERVLPITQYMAYVEIEGGLRGRMGFSGNHGSDLWRGYAPIAEAQANLAMRRIAEAGDIFPVFRDLFSAEGDET